MSKVATARTLENDAGFDLRDPAITIRECTACNDPVAARWESGEARVTCGYCNAALAFTAPSLPTTSLVVAPAYRSPVPRSARGQRLPMDLASPPAGWTGGRALAAVRAAWLAEKNNAAPEDEAARNEREYRLVWFATGDAAARRHQRDFLRARAVLESALDLVELPQYRAMLLARLSRLASEANAPILAKKWLDLVPSGLRVPEIMTDLRIAEGFVARANKEPRKVLEILGEGDASDMSVGPLRPLMAALRADALEAIGKDDAARRAWMFGSQGAAAMMQATARSYGLAPQTQKRITYRGLFALGILCAGLAAAISVMNSIKTGDGSPLVSGSIFLGCLITAIVFRLQRGGPR